MVSAALEAALARDLGLASLDAHLIGRARDLYDCGFSPQRISAAQMAAVGETIRGARDHATAQRAVEEYLANQLRRLRAKQERGGKPESWLRPTTRTEAGTECLGDELGGWVRRELYLRRPRGGDEVPLREHAALDHLAALRRFWGRFHGLYRHHAAVKTSMQLGVLDHGPGGKER